LPVLFKRLTGFSALLVVLLAVGWGKETQGTVYYSKQEALALAFGEGNIVETRELFLTDEQIAKIESMARAKLDSKMFTFYVGTREGKAQAYAAIETHNVRTKSETLLIVLDGEGQLARIHTLAFHEPPEYQPSDKWYAQWMHRPVTDLEFGTNVQGVSGATLSSRAAVDSARRVLAVYAVAVQGATH
jgi:hypothetical protein